MSETYEFPTPLHTLANKYYDNYPEATTMEVSCILALIDERKLGMLYATYSKGTQWTREPQLKALWNKWYPDPEWQLSGVQADILIFLLNMYGCEKAKKIRAKKLAAGNV